MSAFTSPTQIANLALAEVRAARISSLEADTSAQAVACRLHYAHTVETVLRSHPWSFAEKSAALSPDAAAPVTPDWDKAWTLPGDLVRFMRLTGPDADVPRTRFHIAGGKLLTREITDATVTVTYVSNAVTVNQWDALFVDAVRLKLAASIAHDLTGKAELANACLQKYEQLALPDAARVDAQEAHSGENHTVHMLIANSPTVQSRRWGSHYLRRPLIDQ